MLTGVSPVYVGCFARGWHQLSTTDPPPYLRLYGGRSTLSNKRSHFSHEKSHGSALHFKFVFPSRRQLIYYFHVL
jgi:hypothetical protein